MTLELFNLCTTCYYPNTNMYNVCWTVIFDSWSCSSHEWRRIHWWQFCSMYVMKTNFINFETCRRQTLVLSGRCVIANLIIDRLSTCTYMHVSTMYMYIDSMYTRTDRSVLRFYLFYRFTSFSWYMFGKAWIDYM